MFASDATLSRDWERRKAEVKELAAALEDGDDRKEQVRVLASWLQDDSWQVREAAVTALNGVDIAFLAAEAPFIMAHTSHSSKKVHEFARRVAAAATPQDLAPQLREKDESGDTLLLQLGKLDEHSELLGLAVEYDVSLADLMDEDGVRVMEKCGSWECRQAMYSTLNLIGRYRLDTDPPWLHKSDTAVAFAATDHGRCGAKVKSARPQRCAIKAMRETSQVLAELIGRNDLKPKYVIPVKALHVDNLVDPGALKDLREAASKLEITVEIHKGLGERISQELARRHRDGSSFDEIYPFALVLDLGERTLDDSIRHDHIAGEDFPLVRKIITDLVYALDHLHSSEVIHGDLTPFNIVRVQNRWMLIDLDVSSKLETPFGCKVPSSGYCPPEMAKVLSEATNSSTGVVDTQQLQKYVSSVAYDLWSLGIILFHLVTKRSLFHMNDHNGNAISGRVLSKICEFKAQFLKREIDEIRSPSRDQEVAFDLLYKLLEADPGMRLRNFPRMRRLLEHPFLNLQSSATPTVQKLSSQVQEIASRVDRQQELLHPDVEKWMHSGLVQVGVAVPDDLTSGGVQVVTSAGKRFRVKAEGSGFFLDKRGLVFTDEHVRSSCQRQINAASQMGKTGGCILIAAYIGGETDWQNAWKAEVLAHTEDWNSNNAPAPDPDGVVAISQVWMQSLHGRDLTSTERFADAAILRPVHAFVSAMDVRDQNPLLLLASGAPIKVMPVHATELKPGEGVWALGFPPMGGATPTPVRGEISGSYEDEHGEWLKLPINMIPGHSGGPVVDLQGRAVAWNVRDRTTVVDKLAHVRHIRAAQPCIDLAEAKLATLHADASSLGAHAPAISHPTAATASTEGIKAVHQAKKQKH